MQTLRLSNTVAIGATVQNLVAGSKFEFLPVNAAVRIYAVSELGDAVVDFTLGNVVVGDDLLIPFQPAAGIGPNVNEHRIATGAGLAGDRIQLRVTNPNAAPQDVRFLIEILPV